MAKTYCIAHHSALASATVTRRRFPSANATRSTTIAAAAAAAGSRHLPARDVIASHVTLESGRGRHLLILINNRYYTESVRVCVCVCV